MELSFEKALQRHWVVDNNHTM